MKKLSKDYYKLIVRREKAARLAYKRKLGIRKSQKIKANRQKTRFTPFEDELHKKRRDFYKKRDYRGSPIEVEVEGEFGVEYDFRSFIEIATKFIGSRASIIKFDFKKTQRLWPSALTLLCSFKQWTDIKATLFHGPDILSNNSDFTEVNQYLIHSGFYDYVEREHDDIEDKHIFNDSEIVKISREEDSGALNKWQDDIIEVVSHYSSLSDEQIDEFDSVVLTEAINNINEHGFSHRYNGWWTLTQYHKKTKIISICLADNGVGIKNTLRWGPQGKAIVKEIGTNNDGEYIYKALEENVSGAVTASLKDKKKWMTKKYQQGNRRGNGLNRIVNFCENNGVQFSILSNRGYMRIDDKGEMVDIGTEDKKIFAGTLYHFVVPAK